MRQLDRRTLVALAVALGAIVFLLIRLFGDSGGPTVVRPADTVPIAEQRLERLRRMVSMLPGRQAELKHVQQELAAREKGMIVTETAAQAQAQLLELIRRVGHKNGVEVRGAEDLKVKALSPDYGEVSVAVAVTCGIEQLVNLMADLANEPQAVGTSELRIVAGNPKEKTVQVRLGVSGIVPRKLVPEKKGLAAF